MIFRLAFLRAGNYRKRGQARISPMSQVRFQDKTKCATSGKAGFYVEKYEPGPFDFGTYSKSCLLLFGLGFKATSSVAFTVGLKEAARAGVPGAAGASAIFNNPALILAGAVVAADALFEHCRCGS
jgi:hypothetical protein